MQHKLNAIVSQFAPDPKPYRGTKLEIYQKIQLLFDPNTFIVIILHFRLFKKKFISLISLTSASSVYEVNIFFSVLFSVQINVMTVVSGILTQPADTVVEIVNTLQYRSTTHS